MRFHHLKRKYELELELTAGEKRRNKNKSKKDKQKHNDKKESVLPIFSDDIKKSKYDSDKWILYKIAIISSIVSATITVLVMYCLCIKKKKRSNEAIGYDKGNIDSEYEC